MPEAERGRIAKVDQLGKDGKLTMVKDADPAGAFAEPGRGFAAGGAGLFSTVDDYSRFGQMLLNGGELDGVRLLGRKTVQLMTQNHLIICHPKRPTPTRSIGFGLGVSVRVDIRAGQPAPDGRPVRLVGGRGHIT